MRVTIFCNHYRAISDHKTCEAGVEYEQFKGRPHREWPCFLKVGQVPCSGCDKQQFPTAEELAKQEEEDRQRLENIGKARKAIVAHLGGPWKRGTPGAGGQIDCPVCGNREALRFSRAGYNGHIHAACSTPGCVSWME